MHDGEADAGAVPGPSAGGRAPHVAQVSVWLDSYEQRSAVEEALAALDLAWAGYLVVESLYDDYGTTPHAPARRGPTASDRPAC